MNKLAEVETKDSYLKGFEDACKKAGIDPKDTFVKSAQGGFFGTLGRAVAKPVAWGAKTLGAGQFGKELSELNTLRGTAAGKLDLRKFIAENKLSGVRKAQRGGKLKIVKTGPNDYKTQYNGKTVNLSHDALPEEVRSHFIQSGRRSGTFGLEKGKLKALQEGVDVLDANPLYGTVGKYTAGVGAGAGTLATLGSMMSGESKPQFDRETEAYNPYMR